MVTEIIKNPTERQLRDLEGIVYLIRNKLSLKCYIGQTIRSFWERYKGGKWWMHTCNRYLKNSVNLHGTDNFEIEILRQGFVDREKLKFEEKELILEYNTLHPHGYNLIEDEIVWDKIPDESKKEKVLNARGPYVYTILNTETNETIVTCTRTRFCLEHGLKLTQFDYLRNHGHVKHFKLIKQEKRIKNPKCNNPITLRNVETGEIRTFPTRGHFLKEFPVHKSNLSSVMLGKTRQCAGWCLLDQKFEKKFAKGKRSYTLIDPQGNEVVIPDMPEFCRNHPELSYRCVCSLLLSGRRKSYKGWRLPENKHLIPVSPAPLYSKIKIIDSFGRVYEFKNTKEASETLQISTCTLSKMLKTRKYMKGHRVVEVEYTSQLKK